MATIPSWLVSQVAPRSEPHWTANTIMILQLWVLVSLTFIECIITLNQGWTSPQFGTIKSGVVQSHYAQAGYNNVTATGNTIQSTHQYEGKDHDGHRVRMHLQISAVSGNNSATFTITKVRVLGWTTWVLLLFILDFGSRVLLVGFCFCKPRIFI